MPDMIQMLTVQRRTYANEEDCIKNFSGQKIRFGFAMDFAEKVPYLLHPEHIYKLNSKRWLAICELKSANDRVLDCMIACPNHRNKDDLWFYGGESCKECKGGIEEEIQRIRRVLESRLPPYVLKLTQSLSAVGTELVKGPEEQDEVSEKIEGYLRSYLPRITKDNAHLYVKPTGVRTIECLRYLLTFLPIISGTLPLSSFLISWLDLQWHSISTSGGMATLSF
jgi:hypothetical protein